MSDRLPIEPEYVLTDPFTLKLFLAGQVMFSSQKVWLHPLFDLEGYLSESDCDPSSVVLSDRIIGRAAAFLLVRMGIRQLRTQVISRLAIPVLEAHGVEYRCDEIIERIACATESELVEVKDGELAYAMIRGRWERAYSKQCGRMVL